MNAKTFVRKNLGRILVVALVICGLELGGTASVGAVPPTVPAVDVLVSPSDNNVDAGGQHTEEFGATLPAARRIWLGARTRTIKIRSAEFLRADFNINCDATDSAGHSILVAPLRSESGSTDTFRLAVRWGRVSLRSGVPYMVRCGLSGNQSNRVSSWNLRTNPAAGPVISLDDSVTKQVSEFDGLDWWGSNYGSNAEIPIAPGERMRLRSPVGFWKTPGIRRTSRFRSTGE